MLKERKCVFIKGIKKYWPFYMMMSFGVLYFVVFNYATLPGILIAFKNFSFKKGIFGSEWVGLENFRQLFQGKEFHTVFLNTLEISFGKIILCFPVPIILALLLNEVGHSGFKRVIQSTLYLPHFISWIIMAGICTNLFSTVSGMIPLFLNKFGITMPSLMTDPKYFRGFLYGTEIWKGCGWGTVIYMAALSGIDQQLYEAAKIDGCNRLKCVWYITLPSIAVTTVTMLVLNLGAVMSAGFDQIFNLSNDFTRPVSDIIDTYVYRIGLVSYKYEIATAGGIFKSVINAIMLIIANWAAGKIGESSPF